jgi:hypothetical protein
LLGVHALCPFNLTWLIAINKHITLRECYRIKRINPISSVVKSRSIMIRQILFERNARVKQKAVVLWSWRYV